MKLGAVLYAIPSMRRTSPTVSLNQVAQEPRCLGVKTVLNLETLPIVHFCAEARIKVGKANQVIASPQMVGAVVPLLGAVLDNPLPMVAEGVLAVLVDMEVALAACVTGMLLFHTNPRAMSHMG